MKPLKFHYDEQTDCMEIEGIMYSGDFFRSMSVDGVPVGRCFRVESRDKGFVELDTCPEFDHMWNVLKGPVSQ